MRPFPSLFLALLLFALGGAARKIRVGRSIST